MSSLLGKISEAPLDRRHFLQAAAAVGAISTLGLAGCDNSLKETDETSPTVESLEGGEWVSFNCTTPTCAYRCHNRAYVKDGIIVRHGTGDVHPDSPDFPQFRPCVKGLSTRRIATAAERLKYPMKRKSWSPGGGEGVNAHLRGADEWERISWDDAIDMIAGELGRIKETYGNHSFLALGELEPRMYAAFVGSPILNVLGGCLTTWGQASQGGFPIVSINMRGSWSMGVADAQDRMALRHSELIVFWGTNPAWSASGGNMYHFLNAKRASGAKVIFVDPFFHQSAQAIADEWIPCRPGTDGALLEALAYEMITNNWQDQEFLDKYCLGFDAEHMPEDAKTQENFKDYILGEYDGQPKTPEYASRICGTDPDLIRSFAKEISSTKPMAWKSSGAPARTYYGNRYAQLFFTVGWMTGNVGQLGSEVSAGASHPCSHLGTPGGVPMVNFGYPQYMYPPNPICTEPRTMLAIQNGEYDPDQEYGITFTETFKAVVEGEYSVPGPSGVKKPCDIRCIVRDTLHQPASQQSGGYYAEAAFRKETVEFVLVQDRYLVPDAQYADILLPVTTTLEEEYSCCSLLAPAEMALVGRKVIEPYFEAKSDPEIYFMMLDKLGVDNDTIPRMTVKQAEFTKIAGATILAEDGSRKPLVTVTKEDFDAHGLPGEPVEGVIPFKEFIENGGYQLERTDGDHFMNIFDKPFIDDPVANPVLTASGKYEIYSQRLKDYYDVACFNDIDALPKYKAGVQGYEDAGKSEYKYQFITMHVMRHSHSSFSNVKQLDEVFNNDLLMSSYDAEKEGFKKGDWVVASNAEGGQIARRINVVPHLMPGVIILGQGNWRTIDQETGIDIGANANTVCSSTLLGDGYQSYNTNLLKIEPYTGKDLELDYKRAPIVSGL